MVLALFGMIAVPVARAVPEFHAAALWIVLIGEAIRSAPDGRVAPEPPSPMTPRPRS